MASETPLNLIPTDNGGDDGSRTPRLPRWTRQEILVLIQGKRVAENRIRRGRVGGGMGIGSGQVEPKWASVSTYCKRHGVNRGPVQCRKRWSNLSGDYKKIKEWESRKREETESFWVMRNDMRRERKLPGFFDRDVYDILDGGPTLALGLAPLAEEEQEEEETTMSEAVFIDGAGSGGGAAVAATEEDLEETAAVGFSPPENEVLVVVVPDNVQPLKPSSSRVVDSMPISGSSNEKPSASDAEMGAVPLEGRKRKWCATEEDEETETMSLQNKLLDVLEKNGKMLISQLEAQNVNCLLEQERQKNHSDSMLAILSKLADAVGRIADKL